jgi:hypothetical protein
MDDMEVLSGLQAKVACQRRAIANFSEGTGPANVRRARYNRYHSYYAPIDGDQWPEDRADRPNKLHITANIVRSFVDVEGRILALLPRVTNIPPSKDKESRLKGEVIEDLNMRWLELSDWEVWMGDWNRLKSLYGKGILRPFWNAREKRPDVSVVEQPQNLMLGYGSSDFTVIDWAIYQYFLSVAEVRRRWPEIVVTDPGGGRPLVIASGSGDHADPLNQLGAFGSSSLGRDSQNTQRVQQTPIRSDYEDRQVEVWDYWYYDSESNVYNATLVQRVLIDGPTLHPEMPRIPFIVCENDHEPGSAEGISTAEGLIDIQMGMNRVLSHFSQLVADNSGTAYQLTGDNADYVPEGVVPKEDEIIPAGSSNRIEPIMRAVNNFPMQELIKELWNAAHRITGLPEVMFGNIPSGDTSGRVMAIQIEAGQNRIDAKRRREYNALRELIMFWGYMVQQKNPSVTVSVPAAAPAQVDPTAAAPELETKKIKVGDYIKGYERWKIIAPEITPRDSIETAQNVINLVNAKLLPRIEAMDQIGLENPEQMLALIESEMSNARLNPQDVQAYAAVLQLFQAIAAQQQQNAAIASQQAAEAQGPAQAAAQQAQPTGFVDQNQPMSQPGMAPPPGAGVPGGIGELQGLVRNTPGGASQSMSQIKLTGRPF